MPSDFDKNYRILDSLDAKATGLLQVTTIMLVLVALPFFQDRAASWVYIACVIVFMLSTLISLYILWFAKEGKEATIASRRIKVVRVNVVITGIGIVLVAVAMIL